MLEKPALILIDVQREYFTQESPLWIPDGERVLGQLSDLLEAARESGVDGTATRDLSAASGKSIPHAIVHETTLAAQTDGFSTLMDVATARAELSQHVA